MAKRMFYTLEEASQLLGVSADEIKEMALSGKLQQFRDRDKLMFKRDEVDAMTADGGSDQTGGASGTGDVIPLAGDTGDASAIGLVDSVTSSSLGGPAHDSRGSGGGVNIFDTDEVEAVDPMAQTQVTGIGDSTDLSLESVGSGSGLLDLTRESDDTSLGAELLDEIYPGSDSSGSKAGSGVGSSGVFGGSGVLEAPAGMVATMPGVYGAEPSDSASDGLTVGMLAGAVTALVVCLIIGFGYLASVPSSLVGAMGGDVGSMWMWTGGVGVLSFVLGGVGFFIGKSRG